MSNGLEVETDKICRRPECMCQPFVCSIFLRGRLRSVNVQTKTEYNSSRQRSVEGEIQYSSQICSTLIEEHAAKSIARDSELRL